MQLNQISQMYKSIYLGFAIRWLSNAHIHASQSAQRGRVMRECGRCRGLSFGACAHPPSRGRGRGCAVRVGVHLKERV